MVRGKRRTKRIKAKTLGTFRKFGGKRFRKKGVSKLKSKAKKRCKTLRNTSVKQCRIVKKGRGKGYGVYTWGTR